ncbi:hypothetical protein [Capnocytophaga canis]|uniref:hypothetical protein n=1 Tax=Capnocytophaga canis TaxID=1848903 RepID=UPI0037D5A305
MEKYRKKQKKALKELLHIVKERDKQFGNMLDNEDDFIVFLLCKFKVKKLKKLKNMNDL